MIKKNEVIELIIDEVIFPNKGRASLMAWKLDLKEVFKVKRLQQE